MASTSLDILIRARDMASGTIRGVGSSAQRLDSSLGSATTKSSKLGGFMSTAAGKLTALAGGAFVAKQALDFGFDLVKSAEEAEAASKRAFAGIRSDADGANVSVSQLAEHAEAFGNSIGEDDEAVLGMTSRLAQMVNLTEMFGAGGAQAGLTGMTEAIYDMAAATGQSSTRLVKMFANITNDPAAASMQLQKLGVITEEQADRFYDMAESGDDAAASQAMMSAVLGKYQGQAAKGTTASAKLSAIWDNLKETLGGFLLPMFTTLVDWLGRAATALSGLLRGSDDATGSLSTMAEWFGKVRDAIAPVVKFVVDGLVEAWGALVEVWKSNLQPSLAQLWKAFQKLYAAVQPVLKVWLFFQGAVLALALKALPVVIKVLGTLLGMLARVAAFVIGTVAGAFRAIGSVAGTIWRGVSDAVTGAWDRIRGVWDGAKAFFTGIWDSAKSAASTAFNAIRDFWNSTVAGFGFTVPGFIPVIGGQEWRIPYMATGGIVDRATLAMIGEQGPEAVIPLSQAGRFGLGSGSVSVGVNIDRRRWVAEHDYEVTYGGV